MAFSSPSSLSSGPSACLELSISALGFPSSSSPSPNGGGGSGLIIRDLDINQVPALGFEEDEDDDESGGGGGGAPPRKKLRLTKEQSRLLEQSFRDNHTLNSKQKEALAFQLKLRPRQVEVWFQNRRARTKLKQTEMECEYLKRCFGSLTEENRRLQREVEQLRAMKVAPPTVLSPNGSEPLPASTLTMCPRCERVTSNNNNNAVGPTPIRKSMSLFPTTNSHHMVHSRQPSAAC